MTFNRINEHTLRCVLHESEIGQMGYNLHDIFHNQDLATNFLKDILVKANEAGFTMSENYKAIQSTFLPNHEIVLNIMELSVEEPLNEMLQHYLNVYETVNAIGKERLEEILALTGADKMQAFNDYMAKIQKLYAQSSEAEMHHLSESKSEPSEKTNPELMLADHYVLSFRNLDEAELFSKAAPIEAPGRLYKDRYRYHMLINISEMEPKAVKSLLLSAREFTTDIREDNHYSSYLEEHAEIIIKDNPMRVLRRL